MVFGVVGRLLFRLWTVDAGGDDGMFKVTWQHGDHGPRLGPRLDVVPVMALLFAETFVAEQLGQDQAEFGCGERVQDRIDGRVDGHHEHHDPHGQFLCQQRIYENFQFQIWNV